MPDPHVPLQALIRTGRIPELCEAYLQDYRCFDLPSSAHCGVRPSGLLPSSPPLPNLLPPSPCPPQPTSPPSICAQLQALTLQRSCHHFRGTDAATCEVSAQQISQSLPQPHIAHATPVWEVPRQVRSVSAHSPLDTVMRFASPCDRALSCKRAVARQTQQRASASENAYGSPRWLANPRGKTLYAFLPSRRCPR